MPASCPACGDPDGPCELAPCGDPGCLSRDCESHDACESPEQGALIMLTEPVDPDAVLARLRENAAWETEREHTRADSSAIAENAGAMAEDFRALDEWLTWAGLLPADWCQARREVEPDLQPGVPMVVGLRGWRLGARFAVVALAANGIATLRLMNEHGALSPFPQEAHVVNIIWHPDERATAGLDEEEPPWPSS